MKMNERMKKVFSILLCLCMLVQNCPVVAFAAETDNFCDHHAEHTADCGYAAPVAGAPCTHEHSESCYQLLECLHECGEDCDDPCTHECTVENGCITMEADCHHTHSDCGYSEGTAEIPCGHVHDGACGYVEAAAEVLCGCTETDEAGALVHTEGCGYVAPVEGVPCGHTVCDDTCGYAPATEGTPCNHVCEVIVDSDNSCYKLLCSHAEADAHDDTCGYVAGSEGSPCTYDCQEDHDTVTSETEETTAPTEAEPVCTCGTDDSMFHATNCPAYVAPENPECYCAEKCTGDNVNVWCDVCGVQGASACKAQADQGEAAAVYATIACWEDTNNNGTIDSGEATYGNLYEPLSASKTVKLAGDITLPVEATTEHDAAEYQYIKLNTGTSTLDLNGHTLTFSSITQTNAIELSGTANLTIKDSTGGGVLQMETRSDIVLNESSKLTITGGFLNSGDIYYFYEGRNITGGERLTITGGIYPDNPSAYVPDTHKVVYDSATNTYTVSVITMNEVVAWNDADEDGIIDSGEQLFADMKTAVAAGVDLTMNSDVSLGTSFLDVNSSITVDLNGYQIDAEYFCFKLSDGDLTIKDSKGTGILKSPGSGYSAINVIKTSSIVTVEGGNIFGGISGYSGNVILHGGNYDFDPSEYVDAMADKTYMVINKIPDTKWTVMSKSFLIVSVSTDGDKVYNRSEQKPVLQVKNGIDGILTEETDYTVTYLRDGEITSDFTNIGTITIVVNAAGNCIGTAETTYTIKPKSVSEYELNLSADTFTFDGSEHKPTITIGELVENADFTLEYKRNDVVTEDFKKCGTITVTATGTGNYVDTLEKEYTIEHNFGDGLVCQGCNLEKYSYIKKSWNGSSVTSEIKQTPENCTIISTNTTRWNSGYYVVKGEVTISSRVTVTGDVHLILMDEAILTINEGINLSAGNSLAIYAQEKGNGVLKATGSVNNAGIGGNGTENGGSLEIHGGNITAVGGTNDSGIGGGSSGGSVTIYDGTVTATAGANSSAGIGCGSTGTGGVVVAIYGGTVDAKGNGSGAGIGGAASETAGTVTICGGTVTATGGENGAGIGGGHYGKLESINISGGTVTASGGAYGGAGIGGGRDAAGGNITISGGTITASGGTYGAGIGGGLNGAGGTVAITGGNIKATGYTAIGGGKNSLSNGTLTDGKENNVFLNTITLHGAAADTAVTVLEDINYGLKDVKTLDTNKLYFYLPANNVVTSIIADNVKYLGTVTDYKGTFYYEHTCEATETEATCKTLAVCDVCGASIGELNPNNHDSNECIYTLSNDSPEEYHNLTYICCEATAATEKHNMENGICAACGYYSKDLPTENGTYLISNASELMRFAKMVEEGNTSANAKLTADIDMTGVKWTTLCVTESYSKTTSYTDKGYQGVFDGNGHVIRNVSINSVENANEYAIVGLFGTLSGTVKNLGMENVTAIYKSGNFQYIGVIAFQVIGEGTISNCYTMNVSRSGSARSNHIGGITFGNYGGQITNCYTANMNGTYDYKGGIATFNRGTENNTTRIGSIDNCYSDHSNIFYSWSGTVTNSIASVSADRFASGEIAYKLNGSKSEGDLVWYQTIGEDAYPQFEGKTAYCYTNCRGGFGYANDLYEGIGEHHYASDTGICSVCGGAKPEEPEQVNGVYQIKTVGNLFWFADYVNAGNTKANAVVMNDIDMSDVKFYPIAPIATLNYSDANYEELGYEGTFDGGGHTISNLTIMRDPAKPATVGLFGTVSGTVKNLHLDQASYTRAESTDGRFSVLVGQLLPNGNITDCIVTNSTVDSAGGNVGGAVAGCNYGGTITNCVSYNNTVSVNSRCGNLVGDNQNDGSGTNAVLGSVVNCYSTSTVTGSGRVGTVDTASEANVTTERFASGEIAYKLGSAWGQTIGTDLHPVLGGDTVYAVKCAGIPFGYSNEDVSYTSHDFVDKVCTRCGTYDWAKDSEGTYLIYTAQDLNAFAELVNAGDTTANARLMADIDMTGCRATYGNVMIGTSTYKYSGTFDGNGKTVTVDLDSTEQYTALFRYINGATIQNLTVNGNISTSAKFAAGLVGYSEGSSKIEKCMVGVTINSSVGGDGTHGGLVANVSSGTMTINNCAFVGTISGSSTTSCGGFVGWTNGTTNISNSYQYGTFTTGTASCYTFGRNPSKVTVTNSYYSTEYGSKNDGSTQTTADAFASGEVAYNLGSAWGQLIGTDLYPVLGGEVVYYDAALDQPYYNVLHDHSWTYELDGTNKIVASCQNTDGCPNQTVTVTLSAPDAANLTYDGNAKKATVMQSPSGVFGSNDIVVKYVGVNGTDYTESATAPKDAGTYKASLTLGEGTNAKTASVTYTITARSITGATVTVGSTGLTYDGQAKEPAVGDLSVTLIGGTQLTTSDYQITGYGDNINAGTDTATVTIEGKGNYTGTATGTFSIKKAEAPTMTAAATMLRNQSDYTVQLDLTTATGYPTTPGGTPTFAVQAGSYNGLTSATIDTDNKTLVLVANAENADTGDSVTVNVTGMDNYEDGTITVTVSYTDKTDVSNSISLAVSNITYGSEPDPSYDFNGNSVGTKVWTLTYSKDGGSSWYALDDLKTDGKLPAGNYSVKAHYEDNTQIGEKTADFTVDKADASVTTAPAAKTNLTYTGGDQALVTAGEADGGTMQYVVGSNNTTAPESGWSESVPTGADAGTYFVWYKVAGDANHKDTTAVCVEVTINKAQLTPSVSGSVTKNYDGSDSVVGATSNTLVIALAGVAEADKDEVSATADYAYGGADVGTTTINATGITLSGDKAKNYELTATTASADVGTITKVDPSYTVPTGLTATYGNTLADVTLPEGFTWEAADTTSVGGVGTQNFTVKFTPTDTKNYNVVSNIQVSIEVKAAAASVAKAPAANTLTYIGEDQALVTAGEANGGTLVYSTTKDGQYTEMIPTGNGATTYTVWYKVIGDSNHSGTEPQSVEVTIAKAKAEIAVDTTPINVTYGQTVTLPTASSNFGTVACDTKDSDLVDAGTYTVTYSVEGTDNYDGDTKTVTVTIGQIAVAEPVVSGTYTYTGGEQTVILTGVESYMTVASGNEATNAGNYEVEISLNSNYKWADGSDGKIQWSIGKAQAVISVDTDPITVTYGDTVTLPTASSNFGTVDCDKTAADLVNADTYTVTYSVAATDNYDGDSVSISVTINKADGSLTAPTAKTGQIYTGSGLELINEGSSTTGTVQYKLDNGTYGTDIPKATDAGTYTVFYKVVGDANHNDVAEQSFTVTIGKAKAIISVATADVVVTYGEAVTLPKATTNFGTVSCDTKAADLVNANTYTITYSVAATDNYDGDTKSLNVIINPKAITANDVSLGAPLTYNGSEQTQTVTIAEDITYNVTGNKATDVGNYELTVTGTGNFTGEVKLDWSIKAAAATVTEAPVAKSLTYNGKAQALVSAGEADGGTMVYSTTKDGQYTETIPTGTGAATYTVWYKVKGDSNHSDTEAKSVSVTIAKAALSITANDNSITYGEEPANNGVSYQGFVNGETEAVLSGGLNYSYTYDQYGNAGDYKITCEGLTADNYAITYKPGTLTVTAKKITVTVKAAEKTYGDADPAFTYDVTGLENNDTMTGALSREEGENVGKYAITQGTLSAGSNYTIAYTGEMLTINPKAVTVTAEAKTKVYGDSDPELTATVTGLVEGEAESLIQYTLSRAEGENVGDYNITPTGDATQGNYTVTYVPAKLTVTKAKVTVTADNKTKIFGENDPALTATITGLKNGDAESVISYSLSREAGEGVDSYTITPSGNAVQGNYDVVYNSGTLTVNKAGTMTVTATGYEGTYDGDPHAASASVTVTDGTTVYYQVDDGEWTTTAPTITDVGTSTVKVKAENANYDTAYDECTLKVTPLAVTVNVVGANNTADYDGNEHTVSGYTATASSKLYDVKKDFTFSGTAEAKRTNAGTTNMGLAAEQFESTNGNFTVTFNVTDGYLTIKPIDVTVTIVGKSSSVTYNGKEQTVAGYTATAGSSLYDVEKDFTFTGTAEAKRTDVGTTNMGLTAEQFQNTNGNFANVTFNVTDGYQTITPVTDKVTVTITEKSGSGKYDGSEKSVTGYTVSIDNELYTEDDFTFSGDATVKGTDAGTYGMELKSADFTNNSGNFTNVEFVIVDGTLKITKREVTLTSATDTKVYDGKALTNDTVTVSGDGFASGEGAAYDVTGTQTNVGESENTFTYTLNDGTKAANYEIATVEGKLTVTEYTDKVTVTITENSGTGKYNGTEQTVTGYTVSIDNELYKESDFTFSGDATVKGTDAGTYAMALKAEDFANTNPNFSKVEFVIVDGTLEISKRTVTLTSADAEKVYDSTALTNNNVTVTGDGFVTGEGATYAFTGTQTNVGESENTFTYTLNDGTKAGNYVINTATGTLKVTPVTAKVTVTITENSDTVTYDSTEKTVTGYTVKISNSLYTEADFSFSGDATVKGTAAGNYQMELKPADFTNNSANFTNVEFVIVDGKLTIDRKPITKEDVALDGEVIYNGTEQTQKITVTQGITYKVTGNTGTKAGTYTLTVTGTGNYTGTVTLEWTIVKKGAQVTFPGEEDTGLKPGDIVEIDGVPYEVDPDGEIWAENVTDSLMVAYSYNEDEDPHKEYPTGMRVWYLETTTDADGYVIGIKATEIPELKDFMLYKGTSIRVNHSSDGIRFFTAVPMDSLNQAMKGTLLTGDLEGFKLVEMGTLYKWADTGMELLYNGNAKSYVYGGSAGNNFHVFSKEGDTNWFTGMLTELPGDAATLNRDILSRPYAILENADGQQITLYGGSIQRSVYYVALQNRDYWAAGTAYDNYIEKIIATVEAAKG